MRATAFLGVCGVVVGTIVASGAGCTLLVSTDGYTGGPDPGDGGDEADAWVVTFTLVEGGSTGQSGSQGDGGHVIPSNAKVWDGNGHGYEVVTQKGSLRWDEARDAALQRGGHLATITSAEEEQFVESVAKAKQFAFDDPHFAGPWLGGFQPSPSSADEPGNGWQWVTGEPWGYTDWGNKQPDNNDGTGAPENWLEMADKDDPVWNDATEDAGIHAYVVEYE